MQCNILFLRPCSYGATPTLWRNQLCLEGGCDGPWVIGFVYGGGWTWMRWMWDRGEVEEEVRETTLSSVKEMEDKLQMNESMFL